jgi:aspartate-semialdehyde dehydrogenase
MKVAIVGATGAVGQELLTVLEKRSFPVTELVPMASSRSVGTQITFAGRDYSVIEANESAFEGVEIAFFSAGATRSRALVPHAVAAGSLVVDNSSAYRMDPNVPLVVPEINPSKMQGHSGVLANPNCVAAILTMVLGPLAQQVDLRRIVVSTFQSASGAGARAMEDLLTQTTDYLAGSPVVARVLRHPYAFNLFSHDSAIEEDGYNGEENKVVAEIRKILGRPQLPISITCVRVPVLRAHTMTVNIEFDGPMAPHTARTALERSPGVRIVDNPDTNHFPMPNEASGQDDVLVGRIREDPSRPNTLNLFVCGDQLLKGAALNAVQIAEAFLSQP